MHLLNVGGYEMNTSPALCSTPGWNFPAVLAPKPENPARGQWAFAWSAHQPHPAPYSPPATMPVAGGMGRLLDPPSLSPKLHFADLQRRRAFAAILHPHVA